MITATAIFFAAIFSGIVLFALVMWRFKHKMKNSRGDDK